MGETHDLSENRTFKQNGSTNSLLCSVYIITTPAKEGCKITIPKYDLSTILSTVHTHTSLYTQYSTVGYISNMCTVARFTQSVLCLCVLSDYRMLQTLTTTGWRRHG